MTARAMWKAVIRIGGAREKAAPLDVPVKLYAAVRSKPFSFHLLHEKDGQRVEQRIVNPETGEAVAPSEVRKGYEVSAGRFVLLEPQELAVDKPEPSRDIEPRAFVPLASIAPVWLERPYYLGPDGQPERYHALAEALRASGRAAIVTFVMRGKRYAAALRELHGHLALITLRHRDEVVAAPALPSDAGRAADARELKLAEQLVASLEGEFEPSDYHSEYRARLLELIAAKAGGEPVAKVRSIRRAAADKSLAAALKASLAKRRTHAKEEKQSPSSPAARDERGSQQARASRSSQTKGKGSQTKGEGSRAKGRAKGRDEEPARSGPRSFWSGTLSFGLVSIPVELYRGTRSAGLALRMVTDDGTPLARRYVCASEGRELADDELVRGYEIRPGEHVPITDEEIEALEPRKSRDIDLQRFVPQGSIDPIYFDRPFFLAPSGKSTKAYRLLVDTMRRTKRVGIATFVMHAKEHLVAIIASDGLLRAHLLRFQDEVRALGEVGLGEPVKPKPLLVQAYRKAIDRGARDELDPDALRDEGVERVRALIEKKERQQRDVVGHESVTGEAPEARIIDLMEVLKESLTKDSKKAQRK